MLEIKNTEVIGLERSLRASGNPMLIGKINTMAPHMFGEKEETNSLDKFDFEKELERGERLGNAPAGSGHDNFLSGIDVYYDVKYSMYWSMEFQRYHFNQIVSSQSKMHRLTNMGKDWDSFITMFNEFVDPDSIRIVFNLIQKYNNFEEDIKTEKMTLESINRIRYELFMRIVSSLPAGFEQWMTIKTNYLQLKTMYQQRKNHKLKDDWGVFCDWCLSLPYFKELTGVK